MEKIVRIKEVGEYTERQFTNRDGKTDYFRSRGFVFTCGDEEFYGEMTGDYAARNRDTVYDKDRAHMLKGAWRHRPWQTKEGESRHENWLVVNTLTEL